MNDSQAVTADGSGTQPTDGGRVIVHIWEVVDPDQADLVVQRVEAMLAQVAREPGYVSARVLESEDRRSVATAVEMRTSEDRQRVESLPIVQDTLTHIEGTMNIIVRRYRERESL